MIRILPGAVVWWNKCHVFVVEETREEENRRKWWNITYHIILVFNPVKQCFSRQTFVRYRYRKRHSNNIENIEKKWKTILPPRLSITIVPMYFVDLFFPSKYRRMTIACDDYFKKKKNDANRIDRIDYKYGCFSFLYSHSKRFETETNAMKTFAFRCRSDAFYFCQCASHGHAWTVYNLFS